MFTKDEEYVRNIQLGDHLGMRDHLLMEITVNELLEHSSGSFR